MTRLVGKPPTAEATDAARGTLPTFALWTAVVGQFVLLPVTLGTAAVLAEYYDVSAPGWPIIALYVFWGLAVAALITTARRRPMATPIIPVANAALLVGLITFGVNVVGWHA